MDQSILLAFYNFVSGDHVLSALAIFFAEWLPYLFILAIVCFVFLRRAPGGVARSFFFIFSPATVAWLFAAAIKFLFPVLRPFAALHLTPLVLGENPLASFPSAHATFFAALGMTVFLQNKKIGKWFLLGALLIGLARIMVGIHWPSDILAGFLLGGLVAAPCDRLWMRFSKKPLHLEGVPL